MTQEDYRKELLLWILIMAFEPMLPRMETFDLHLATRHFITGLNARGVTGLGFYPDVVSEMYPEVENAVLRLVAFQMAEWDDRGRTTLRMSPRVKHRLVAEQKDLTPHEVRLAQDAAESTKQAWWSGTIRRQPAR